MRLIVTGAWLAAAAALAAAGCSSGPVNAPVDAARARAGLKTALESWKRGDRVDALQGASPPIYVIDPDWQAGAVLVDYQMPGDGKEMDANLFCPAVLTLKAQGKAVTREATYIIGTSPTLTIGRKLF